MSNDLIRRSDAIAEIRKARTPDVASYQYAELFINAVCRAPSADRPQGKWINHFDDLFPEESTIECSICNEHQPMGIDDNFCPNCGADMREGE